MWGTITPETGLNEEDKWRSLWFDLPFGVSVRCKELDAWSSGKRGNDPKKVGQMARACS